MECVRRFLSADDGQDVVEYGLLIATLAMVILVASTAFGAQITAWLSGLAGRITTTVS